jgi:hypothetical protein
MSEDLIGRVKQIRQSREAADVAAATAPADADAEIELLPDSTSDPIAWSRSSKWPEVSLRLGFQKGQQRALPYHMLQDVFYDPDVGLRLEFVHCQVEIQGRNLAPLFDRLADHKVRFIRELEELAAEAFPEGETVVTRIALTAHKPANDL